MTEPTLYPHQSIWMIILAVGLFVIGVITFMSSTILSYLTPLSNSQHWCSSQTYVTPSPLNWNMIVGIFLMAVAIFIVWKYYVDIGDTPDDIEKQIKQHEDAIAKLRVLKMGFEKMTPETRDKCDEAGK